MVKNSVKAQSRRPLSWRTPRGDEEDRIGGGRATWMAAYMRGFIVKTEQQFNPNSGPNGTVSRGDTPPRLLSEVLLTTRLLSLKLATHCCYRLIQAAPFLF